MKRLVCPGLCFTLSLVLVFGSILLSPTVINVALANDMSDAPMTKDTTTAGSDGDDDNGEDKGDDEDGKELPSVDDAPVTIDTITDSSDNNGNDDSGQSSNDETKKENDSPQQDSDRPECPAGQECRLFGTPGENDNTAVALNFGDCEANAVADQDIEVKQEDDDSGIADQDIEVTQEDDDSGTTTLPPPPPTSTTILTPIPTPSTPTQPQDQSKASLCPHEPEVGLFGGDVTADNTATALNFGDRGADATANQDIEVNQK
jgi:hypothetical protein